MQNGIAQSIPKHMIKKQLSCVKEEKKESSVKYDVKDWMVFTPDFHLIRKLFEIGVINNQTFLSTLSVSIIKKQNKMFL